MKNKILRILLSPFVFLYGIFFTAAMCLFPIPLIMGFSLGGLITQPFIWMFRKTGSDIEYLEPFFLEREIPFRFFGYLAGITVPLWAAFYITYVYIQTGEIKTGD